MTFQYYDVIKIIIIFLREAQAISTNIYFKVKNFYQTNCVTDIVRNSCNLKIRV